MFGGAFVPKASPDFGIIAVALHHKDHIDTTRRRVGSCSRCPCLDERGRNVCGESH